MYLILDSFNRIAEICEHPSYVRRQSNGVVVLSDKDHADAIYSNDSNTFWSMIPIGYLCDSHILVEVEAVPSDVIAGYYFYHAGEFYTTENDLSALARAKAPDVASLVFVSMSEKGEFDDTTITEHAEQFSKWTALVSYTAGAIVRYENKLYRCVQSHTSQQTWTPDATASLWKQIGDPSEEWPAWSQPLGAHDAYPLGAKVSHNEKHWISTVDNNVWEPGAYGWEEEECATKTNR